MIKSIREDSNQFLQSDFTRFPGFSLHCKHSFVVLHLRALCSTKEQYSPGGGGGTSYKWANGDVPLDGVAFSRQD